MDKKIKLKAGDVIVHPISGLPALIIYEEVAAKLRVMWFDGSASGAADAPNKGPYMPLVTPEELVMRQGWRVVGNLARAFHEVERGYEVKFGDPLLSKPFHEVEIAYLHKFGGYE